MFHAAFFFTSLPYIENDQRNIEYRIFYPSPVSPKGREAVCLLADKLIDKALLYF